MTAVYDPTKDRGTFVKVTVLVFSGASTRLCHGSKRIEPGPRPLRARASP